MDKTTIGHPPRPLPKQCADTPKDVRHSVGYRLPFFYKRPCRTLNVACTCNVQMLQIKGRPPPALYLRDDRLALGDDWRGSLTLANKTAGQAQRSHNQSQCNRNFFHGTLQLESSDELTMPFDAACL